jgi:hypothetical protein
LCKGQTDTKPQNVVGNCKRSRSVKKQLKEMTEEKLIEKLKQQTNELWQTMQEAKKSNLTVQVGFDDIYTKPELKIMEVKYYQG